MSGTDSIDQAPPFDTLNPDTLLDAVESIGVRCDGRALALNSYENRVYRLGTEDGGNVVVKFYRPERWSDSAILEEHQFAAELAAREVPVVAPLLYTGESLHRHGDFRFAVFPNQGGRAPDLEHEEDFLRMGRFIARIHAVGAAGTFAHRPRVDPERLGDDSREFLLDSGWVPPHLEASYSTTSEHLLEVVAQRFDEYAQLDEIRLHGDCHLGNVLWTDTGPHFVDLDDCLTGPAVQDLWMLLSGDRAEMTWQLAQVLTGYDEFFAFDARELGLIESLRSLRMIYHTAWVARRWSDPAFPRAFPWLEEDRFWEEHVLALKEQLAAVHEPPLECVSA